MTTTYIFQAIILAAGSSSRMGEPKQLLKVEGTTMLDHAITAALTAGIERPILVLGAASELVLAGSKLASSCELVVNHNYLKGQASSLTAGAKKLSRDCQAVIFLLCDQPKIDGQLVKELMAEFLKESADILYPVHEGKRGNPVIFGRSLFPRLLTATGDQGARFLFKDKTLNIIAHPVDNPAVVMDIDTQEEYRLLSEKAE